MEFDALNVRDDSVGQQRWIEMGRPLVPSLVVEGQPIPILHVSQIASILGLPQPDTTINAQAAWDTVTILTSWLEQYERTSWELLNAPTPSRGRTLRHLTVNTFHPFELLPKAWTEGRFLWDARNDPEREAAMPTKRALGTWAHGVLRDWQVFVMDHEEVFGREDREVETLRGTVTYSVILTSQRWHCAFHHRQLAHFLSTQGCDMSHVLDVEHIRDIELAPEVY